MLILKANVETPRPKSLESHGEWAQLLEPLIRPPRQVEAERPFSTGTKWGAEWVREGPH